MIENENYLIYKKITNKKATSLQVELVRIQKELKSPKNQTNTHGNFKFRSAEDITEGYKLIAGETTLLINDQIVQKGDRFYIRATATLTLGEETISSVAYAREPESQSGMNAAQITGSSSSYARKYALNGLFAIDDTKDADVSPEEKAKTEAKVSVMDEHDAAIQMIDDIPKLQEYWEAHKGDGLGKVFAQMVKRRKIKLSADVDDLN